VLDESGLSFAPFAMLSVVVLSLDSIIDLFPMHRYIFRSTHSDPDLVAFDAQDGYRHLVTDHQSLADPTSQYQHIDVLNSLEHPSRKALAFPAISHSDRQATNGQAL
jgi:hypothetical protein